MLRVVYAIVRLSSLIGSSKVIKVGGKQKPYEMWRLRYQNKGTRARNPASYAGYLHCRRYHSVFIHVLYVTYTIWKLKKRTFENHTFTLFCNISFIAYRVGHSFLLGYLEYFQIFRNISSFSLLNYEEFLAISSKKYSVLC